jgi:hypothetical protein
MLGSDSEHAKEEGVEVEITAAPFFFLAITLDKF